MERTTKIHSFESTSARKNEKAKEVISINDAPEDAFQYNAQLLGLSNNEALTQKKANPEEEEELQMKKGAESSQSSMPEDVQTKMESSFGADFSSVNIHENSSSAKDMNALAYTQGNDVHFAPGQYNPESQKGQELLGHELTHVVQQRQGRVKGAQNKGGISINDDAGLEHEADVMGRKAASGNPTLVTGKGFGVQKSDDPDGDVSTYSVTETGGKIKLKLGDGEETEANTKELTKTVAELRSWLKSNYNWNAIVAIMKYCAENDTDFTYNQPSNLEGNADDDAKIIPLDGLKSIVKIQAKDKIDSLENGLTAADYSTVLAVVDGLPGTSFAKDIMGEDSKHDLMNELDNTTLTNEDGEEIVIPDMNSSEDTLYTFFKEIALARNGLWSDEENVTNLVSIRRKLDTNVTKYNDTIAVCWVSKEGENEVKHAKLYSSTTEPGEINNHRKLVPQTMTMQLGYHKGRQPAGRTSQALIRNAANSETTNFNASDTTMNFHHGGQGQVNIAAMSTNGLSTDYISTEETEFDVNLLFISAFKILTQWGKKQDIKSYDYLKEWKEAKKYEFEKIEDGKATFKKEGDESAQERDVASIKTYIASKYSANKEKKEEFVRIMQSVDEAFESPENLDSLDAEGLEALIKEEHIKGILEKQMDYSTESSDIDGKPGSSYLKILDGEVKSFDDMKSKATTDYDTLEQVFTDLKEKLGDTEGDKKVKYLKGLKPGTLNEREKYASSTENDDKSEVIDQNVGAWSEGCQVVFGPEKFYEFWGHVTDKAADTKQKRWYYTIIDAETLETTTEATTE